MISYNFNPKLMTLWLITLGQNVYKWCMAWLHYLNPSYASSLFIRNHWLSLYDVHHGHHTIRYQYQTKSYVWLSFYLCFYLRSTSASMLILIRHNYAAEITLRHYTQTFNIYTGVIKPLMIHGQPVNLLCLLCAELPKLFRSPIQAISR